MKLLLLALAGAFFGQICPVLAQSALPGITQHPQSATVDHGANAYFSVAATGTSLRYQWLLNNEVISDYGNTVGALSPSLRVIGVAQKDAGEYQVVVNNSAGSITSRVATLTVEPTMAFSDDFESGTLGEWTAFSEVKGLLRNKGHTGVLEELSAPSMGGMAPEATKLLITQDRNHSPAGRHSAQLVASRNKMFHNLGAELEGHVKFTFWVYDDGTQERFYGELRGYTGAGHMLYRPPGGLKQVFAVGRYGVGFGERNGTGTLAGEKVDASSYQGRVLRGTNSGWFNLNGPGVPARSIGWHRFDIERLSDASTLRFFVDGVLARTIVGAAAVLIDCVAIGSAGDGNATGNVWFDDVAVLAFPWTFDWQSKDSFATGLPDWMQFRETGSDLPFGTVSQIFLRSGSEVEKVYGTWKSDGTTLSCLGIRGTAKYVLEAPQNGVYRVEVEGRERNSRKPPIRLPLIITIDDEVLGRYELSYKFRENGLVHCFTPFIRAGMHRLGIEWDNAQSDYSLQIVAVRLQSLPGPDKNGNSIPDWQEKRLQAQSRIEVLPKQSLVSPVCVEGRGHFLGMMRCSAGPSADLMQRVAIEQGAGDQWYANVPLCVDRSTLFAADFQNGGIVQYNEIRWAVTDLLAASDITIRKGDALLLTAGLDLGQGSRIIALARIFHRPIGF